MAKFDARKVGEVYEVKKKGVKASDIFVYVAGTIILLLIIANS